MISYMEYLQNSLAAICGNPAPADHAGYRLHRNKDGSGDAACMICGCIHRIDGPKKQMLNNKQIRCKCCGAALGTWIRNGEQ